MKNPIDNISLEQQSKYRINGLTYISNNESIVKRDSAGNIILADNALLIIDPVTEQITTKSALRVLDTRFQYYKFPATIKTSAADTDLIIDLDFESDTIAARYTIVATIDAQNQPQTLQRIGTTESTDWFTNGGENQSGFTRLPFVGGLQSEIGSYTITPAVLETLRKNRKTLKFSIQTQFNSSVTSETIFKLRINRLMPEVWRSTGTLYQLEAKSDDTENQYPYFYLDYVIDIFNDAAAYDKYVIEVEASEPSWVLTENCYWKIDVIDVLTTASLNGDIGTGVYQFSNNTTLSSITNAGNEVTKLYEKDSNGQLINSQVPD
jgi:hypothetical protein